MLMPNVVVNQTDVKWIAVLKWIDGVNRTVKETDTMIGTAVVMIAWVDAMTEEWEILLLMDGEEMIVVVVEASRIGLQVLEIEIADLLILHVVVVDLEDVGATVVAAVVVIGVLVMLQDLKADHGKRLVFVLIETAMNVAHHHVMVIGLIETVNDRR